jgi:hypothetical protein
MKLLPHFFQVAGPGLSHTTDATAYLLEGQKGLYLIDCGTPFGYSLIVDNIRYLGFDLKPSIRMQQAALRIGQRILFPAWL